MESSRRDLSNDMAEYKPILKKKYVPPPFWFYTQITGIEFPNKRFCFYCVALLLYGTIFLNRIFAKTSFYRQTLANSEKKRREQSIALRVDHLH